ncbi:hypothetical protein HELRODRAFT_171908 [Helobdella robusta]|uniref:Apple domain-containing protein n=1 Tax=Helobdella robusta TaxID=6412 RepID=T1F4T9_HELRO|nr:hypothetical protein HELRODRAFT_171908 [Helobdella robusta]ESO04906.1 hypothetical protein HELRODRAFT_171908 [Helobdella robusta]
MAIRKNFHIAISMFLMVCVFMKLPVCVISSKNCFRRLEEGDVDFCSCDHSIEDRSLSTFSFLEALMLCSMRCSQTASCVAYNFFNATNQCQLFNQTLNKFSVMPGCQYYLERGDGFRMLLIILTDKFNKYRRSTNLFLPFDSENFPSNKPLTITVDNMLLEFYLNGKNIPVASNFPNAKVWNIADTYNMTGNVHVIALKTFKNAFDGGFIASTADNYILTNKTWKCTMNYYDGWYKIGYNDSMWPAARYAMWPTSTDYYPPLSLAARHTSNNQTQLHFFLTFDRLHVKTLSLIAAIEDRSWSTFSFLEALMLCSIRCSQTASCVAYNFFSATKQCQLFNQTLNKFSVVSGCQYYLKKTDGPKINKILSITVDDILAEFYFNGNNISLPLYFPNANYFDKPDAYQLIGNLYVIGVKSDNNQNSGGIIASTADNYILTNETWKCTEKYYVGWYKINYNDSFWPAAVQSVWQENEVNFCSCDPAIEDRSLSTFSFLEALMLCSMRCSQTASCVAYNFFNATNQCQLFNQTLNKFSVLPGCQYYLKRVDGLLANHILNITVDNELREFYFNGNNISVASNFPNAVYWNQPDSYNLEVGDIHVLAFKIYNNEYTGGFIASTPDDYILTNETWKCTLEYYDGWYKIHYNDSFWPDAKLQIWNKDAKLLTYFSPNAKWIIDSTDCRSCLFYCRKNFIGMLKFLTNFTN